MKRIIATFAIVALVGAMIFVAIHLAFMDAVADEEFEAFIRDQAPFSIEARQTKSVSSLPMMLFIRFPKSDPKGGLGFPDRTDVYTLASTSGEFVCHAHVRQNRVCHVTFSSAPPSDFRERLVGRFPELSVR